MQSIGEILDTSTRRALALIFGLVLIFIWVRVPDRPSQILSFATAESSDLSDVIIIPVINVFAPVVYVDSFAKQDVDLGLSRGVVHIAGTAGLGEVGNSYILGNSSNLARTEVGYNQVFKKLPQLKIGDDIIVDRDRGQSLIYQVIDLKISASDNFKVKSNTVDKRKLITLETPYGSGSAPMIYLVVAELK